MKRKRDNSDDDRGDDGPRCYFCGSAGEWTTYSIWAGFCVSSKRTSDWWSGKTRVEALYRDLKQIGIHACDACVQGWWTRRYLIGTIGWGVPTFLILIGAAIVPFLGLSPSNMWGILITLSLFGVLIGLLWVLEVWELVLPSYQTATVEYMVLDRVQADFEKEGDSVFTDSEYRCMFLHESPDDE
ncbi:MAG: hypothetical protein FJ303_23890 [Planctomycetes bacterium]|nr:hypothetical protein [Planctomycetota bacterium]